MKGINCTLAALLGAALFAPSAQADDVMAFWRFNDGTENKVSDCSGNDNSGVFTKNFKWMQGAINGCAQMDHQSGVLVKHSDSLNADKTLSIDGWFNPWAPNFNGSASLLTKDGAYSLHFTPSKSLALSLWLNGEKQTFESKNKAWKNGQWFHAAATFDGSTVSIYLNGELDSTHKTNGGKISSSTADVVIGGAISCRFDDVKIQKSVLSAPEISQTSGNGFYEMARRENRFTDFYEKNMKRDAKAVVAGTLWIDTEDFDDYGGWWMDTQFVPQMGSPYLIAPGIGKPVENAKTSIEVPEAGKYKLWVRNKNWIAQGHEPGKFAVSINGKKSETTFGTGEQRAWIWQDGGTFDLPAGATSIELEDLTGYYGRCDALILTKDLEFTPKQAQKDYLAERGRFVEAMPMKDMGHYDVVVVGAGVAGINASIAASRNGMKVALVQDRPMIGGGNSAELGVPLSGGSSIGRGRETGINEEIGRIHSFNFTSKWAAGAELALENEPNVTVFLNSHVFEAERNKNNEITSVKSFDMLDGHLKKFSGKIFIDCTGDGWLGYYAGAEWMWGREAKETFGESLGKPVADRVTMSGSLFQNSILGYTTVDTGKPAPFSIPDWGYDLRPMAEGYKKRDGYQKSWLSGNWWTENQGDVDDLWDPEWARDDLILISLSYYNWAKNHSEFQEKAKNYELKFIPITNCKRETRRLVGDHVLTQDDIMNRVAFPDRVGYRTWKLDVHHPLGIFSKGSAYDYENYVKPSSFPFRILYSKDVPNMLMAGRHVSVSHVALGSTRVQGTTGMMGQVVGTAAAMCVKKGVNPRGIYQNHIPELQQKLLKDDLTIPHVTNKDPNDVARTAKAFASSSTEKDGPENAINGLVRPMDSDMEMVIGSVPNNMWISNPNQALPQWIALDLRGEKTVNSIYLTFDTNLAPKRHSDWQQLDSERMPPEAVRDYQVQVKKGDEWKTVASVENNYQRRRIHRFPAEKTSAIRVLVTATNGDKSARVYEIRAYNE